MRKVLLSAFFVTLTGTALFAQKLSDVQKKISQNNFAEAKADLDKMLADPKNQKDANVWYNKAVVYNALSKDTTQENSALRSEAFEAYKKYQELDPKNIMGTLELNVTLFDLHSQNLNNAYRLHNNRQYDLALKNYKNALIVQDYINSKNFSYMNQSLPKLDTMTIFYAGNAALFAKDTAEALRLFDKLVQAKIGGEDYEFAYQTLVDYYARHKDKAAAEKYAAIGKQVYPKSNYYLYYELQDPALKDNPTLLFAKYEEMIGENPTNSELKQEYAFELFDYVYKDDVRAKDSVMQQKVRAALLQSIQAEPGLWNNYILYSALQNEAYYLNEVAVRINSTKPEDVKRKNAMIAAVKKRDEEAVKYGEVAAEYFAKAGTLKASEKANYTELLKGLSKYYKSIKQLDKAAIYEQRLKEIQ